MKVEILTLIRLHYTKFKLIAKASSKEFPQGKQVTGMKVWRMGKVKEGCLRRALGYGKRNKILVPSRVSFSLVARENQGQEAAENINTQSFPFYPHSLISFTGERHGGKVGRESRLLGYPPCQEGESWGLFNRGSRGERKGVEQSGRLENIQSQPRNQENRTHPHKPTHQEVWPTWGDNSPVHLG